MSLLFMHRVYCALVFRSRSSPQYRRALSNCYNLLDRDSVTQAIYLLALLFSSKLWSDNHRPRDTTDLGLAIKKQAAAYPCLFASSVYSQRKRKSFPNDLYVYHHQHMAFPHSIQRNVTVPVIPPSSIFLGNASKPLYFPSPLPTVCSIIARAMGFANFFQKSLP